MFNPRQVAVLVRFRSSETFEDKTAECLGYRFENTVARVKLPRRGTTVEYRVPQDGFQVLENPVRVATSDTHLIVVRGKARKHATEVWRFEGPTTQWYRVFVPDYSGNGEIYWTHPAHEIELLPNAATGDSAEVLDYLRRLVAGLSSNDPLREPYAGMNFVHEDSALARYLERRPIEQIEQSAVAPKSTLFPFSFNTSQRDAVEHALAYPVSVIDGPPGTGKTQTILNLIANIVSVPDNTVGVVSFNNAAVDNVRAKLEDEGIGFIIAGLGNKKKRETFFAAQHTRNQEVAQLLKQTMPDELTTEELSQYATRLRSLQETERRLAELRELATAYHVELRHFEAHLPGGGLPELDSIPLLKRSSTRILRFLAESEAVQHHGRPIERLIARVKGYFLYGSTKLLDPEDTQQILQLQQAFYRKRISELDDEITECETQLQQSDFNSLAERHRHLSYLALHSALHHRYSIAPPNVYTWNEYKQRFSEFTTDYPLILSTCHSIRRSLPEDQLLDYLIIDEASQVDLLTGALAMSVCRNLIVVGDERQLPQISDTGAARYAGKAPLPAYEYETESLLTSLVSLYGDSLPRTLLREHYRCHPDIIGFCNKKFYQGQLIPYTRHDSDTEPLRIVRTSPGNHMRQHLDGGKTNQREAELVAQRIIPEYFSDVSPERIGITTPYRRQVSKITDVLIGNNELLDHGTEVDTVHKFQGREKDIVIMSSVLDSTRQGTHATAFADDPHLINVAVSRAVKQFVLVTHHTDLPRSRNLKDLIGYIGYRYPEYDIVDDTVISVFDLLYQEYSEQLYSLSRRLRGNTQYNSEDIIWTVLREITAQPEYSHLSVVTHVRLRNLITDTRGLTSKQASFVMSSSHFDFIIYNRVTNGVVLALEVDGFAYHENSTKQLARDALKDSICAAYDISLLRLPTTGSNEREKIAAALQQA